MAALQYGATLRDFDATQRHFYAYSLSASQPRSRIPPDLKNPHAEGRLPPPLRHTTRTANDRLTLTSPASRRADRKNHELRCKKKKKKKKDISKKKKNHRPEAPTWPDQGMPDKWSSPAPIIHDTSQAGMLEPAVGSLGGGRANPQGAPIVHTSSDQLGTLKGLENFVRPSGMISFRNVRGFFCSMLPISPSIAIVNPCQEKTMTKMRYIPHYGHTELPLFFQVRSNN